MSEEKKCCGSCRNKELNNEQLDKVTGGGWKNGKFICVSPHCKKYINDGDVKVCGCIKKTNGKCCLEYKNNSICENWDKI